MKSRHSMEIRAMLEQKKITHSRYNPQSSTNISTCISHNNKTLKRSESSSTLRRTDTQITLIQERYRTLQLNYKDLLQETKRKGYIFNKQKQELDWYKANHQRDKKEIQRLHTLIGFVKKNQQSALTNISPSLTASIVSRSQKQFSSLQKERNPLSNKASLLNKQFGSSKIITPLKKVNNRVRIQEGRTQFSKYRFVPSIPLQ